MLAIEAILGLTACLLAGAIGGTLIGMAIAWIRTRLEIWWILRLYANREVG